MPAPIQALLLCAITLATFGTANAAETNGTSDGVERLICHEVTDTYYCKKMQNANWDDVKYACSWTHGDGRGSWTNFFYKRFDGGLSSECSCKTGLWTYDPWGSRWTKSSDGDVTCYTRDGQSAQQVRSQFDSINCPAPTFSQFCDDDGQHL